MSGRFTTVPAVAGMNQTTATEAAKANDLGVTVTEEHSETVPVGMVIRTDPTSGERLVRGSEFTLVMSLGPERYPAPGWWGSPARRPRRRSPTAGLPSGRSPRPGRRTRPRAPC
nr:PASTA domain-containing protein [Tessaracoccus coleopterorum]